MALTPATTALLIAFCVLIHYEVLQLCDAGLQRLRLGNRRGVVMAAVAAALVSHVLQIAVFAAAFYALVNFADVGRIGGSFNGLASSYLYFSTETYTSLGFGDVFPLGQIRLVAGMEALTGLVMISWTASFTYLQMSRSWRPTHG